MAVKLDMSKGYDYVKWNHFRLMILHMGFHQRWVNLIMSCVSLVTNVALSFLICAEGLSALLWNVEGLSRAL